MRLRRSCFMIEKSVRPNRHVVISASTTNTRFDLVQKGSSQLGYTSSCSSCWWVVFCDFKPSVRLQKKQDGGVLAGPHRSTANSALLVSEPSWQAAVNAMKPEARSAGAPGVLLNRESGSPMAWRHWPPPKCHSFYSKPKDAA